MNHAETYARGKVHTNGLENFWSLLKRGLRGTYVSVEPFHLFRYLDEQSFRYNNRIDMNDYDRFRKLMSEGRWQARHLQQADWETGRRPCFPMVRTLKRGPKRKT